ncbi:MAG TPA: hypothetical protein VF183_09595 [Acidimicrobiales bacterium]
MRTPALALAAWTVFVWATRIRNALGDDELSGAETAIALTTSVVFVALALAVLVAVVRSSHVRLAVAVLAALSVVYWPVRVVQITLADHSVGFTVVHAALGVVSVVLSVWAWRAVIGRARSPRAAGVLHGS